MRGAAPTEAADGVTLCVTSAGRPDLLATTLSSLLAANRGAFAQVIVIDDRGDPAAASEARAVCPDATVLLNRRPLGHLRSVDRMYRRVRTPFIFHCEDDWRFDPVPFVDGCLEILGRFPAASGVLVRKPEDTPPSVLAGARTEIVGGTRVLVLSPAADPVWNGFSFNPCLLRHSLWRRHGPYARFRREYQISLDLRSRASACSSSPMACACTSAAGGTSRTRSSECRAAACLSGADSCDRPGRRSATARAFPGGSRDRVEGNRSRRR